MRVATNEWNFLRQQICPGINGTQDGSARVLSQGRVVLTVLGVLVDHVSAPTPSITAATLPDLAFMAVMTAGMSCLLEFLCDFLFNGSHSFIFYVCYLESENCAAAGVTKLAICFADVRLCQ